MPRNLPIVLLVLLAGLVIAGPGARAQPPTDQSPADQSQSANAADIAAWQAELERIAADLDEKQPLENQLDRLGKRLDTLIAEAEQHKAAAAGELAGPQAELGALGPEPEEGKPAEAADITAQRDTIRKRIAAIDAQIKQSELSVTRAEELLSRISEIRRQRLSRHLFTRGAPIFSGTVWRAAAAELSTITDELVNAIKPYRQPGRLSKHWPELIGIALAATITLFVTWLLRRWLLQHYGRTMTMAKPSYGRRTLTAFSEGLARGLLPSLALALLIMLIIRLGSIAAVAGDVLIGLASGIVFYVTASALINAALVPDATFWRIVPVNSSRARKLSHRLRLLAGVCGVCVTLFIATARFRPYGEEFYSIVNLAFSSVIALLLSTLLKKGLWQASADDGTTVEDDDRIRLQRKLWAGVRLSLIAILIITLGLALYGYTNLASFTLSRIVLSAVLIGGLLMLRRLLHELLEQIYMLFYPPVTADAGPVPAPANDDAALAPFWLGLAMDLLLLFPALMLLLSFWGMPQTTVYLWGRSFLEGFSVGELRFSPGRILMALLVFGVAFLLTRVLRHMIRDQLLTRTHLDAGIKHSVSTGVVYLGSGIALLLAIATLGVSLTNLALIFGALSVGIGLGLQHVVNNFVSGLVLLIQRPIRVGDWIVVGTHEGVVRNVNVIATEIETFDKASILIPNSDILSSAVVNWTRNDRTIRIIINVGVAYGSDTRQVHDLLLECAEQHDEVLARPKPYVLFSDFGDSALNFELRAYVGVDHYFIVASDLRFRIEQALRQANIVIPFPQRELHINQSLSSLTPAEIPEPDPGK